MTGPVVVETLLPPAPSGLTPVVAPVGETTKGLGRRPLGILLPTSVFAGLVLRVDVFSGIVPQ